MRILYTLLFCMVLLSCSSQQPNQQEVNISTLSWEEIEQQAQGTTVTWMMWQGDPFINQYVREFVVPKVREKYGINLSVINGQGTEIVNLLLAEKEAQQRSSQIDLCWINGETFFQLRTLEALHGPFVTQLPNAQYLNMDNPFIGTDFQQKVDGYECPWGNVQMALIYDSSRVSTPPMTLTELEQWVQEHPGKFTWPTDFTGMTLLKSWLMEFAGGKTSLNGDFNEQQYAQTSEELWSYINRIKPYLWNKGESFPNSTGQLHQLFASGELWFTMSNNDGEVDNKIQQGLFSEQARAYVPETGSIQNSHYLGIAKWSANKAGAMAVVNFLISPEAQLEKMKPSVWGDGTVLDLGKLPKSWQEQFENIPGRKHAPKRSEIQDKALMEPDPEYMIRLFADFRQKVIEG